MQKKSPAKKSEAFFKLYFLENYPRAALLKPVTTRVASTDFT